MRIGELDYELPAELIAQTPVEPRDASRLLVYSRSSGAVADRRFADLPDVLTPGDLLVRNDTRVIPARTHFRRATGGRLEVLFLEAVAHRPPDPAATPRAVMPALPSITIGERATSAADDQAAPAAGENPPQAAGEPWEVLVGGRPRVGEVLSLAADAVPAGDDRGATDGWCLLVEERLGGGRWLVRSLAPTPVVELLEAVGEAPLPPYIRSREDRRERYQTVYARVPGSAAAPTAGLHFTHQLDARLAARGVAVEALTLHVGLGTFQPVTAEQVEAHELHSEAFAVDPAAWARIAQAKRDGRRVIAVGTTTTRLLETLARSDMVAAPAAADDDATRRGRRRRHGAGDDRGAKAGALFEGRTGLFITPGFRFALVDGLLTNFHLPRTSLLALVMAFCGVEETRGLYRHAIARGYRFYSFGDAMLAL
jgi:S-adenosylmethionine:tRNA ribosyltransferase-isomerase